MAACSSAPNADEPGSASDGSVGSLGLELQLAPGITVNAIGWSISNAGSGFARSGSVNVQNSNRVRFQIGAVPSGAGYRISLTATSVDGSLTCAGSASFDVTQSMTTNVAVNLSCAPAAANTGTVVVTGTTEICANLDSITVLPLETTVNQPIALSAAASAGSAPASFTWTATAGSFDDPSSATPIFTCPELAGTVTITVTASPSSAACTTVTSQSVDVTCDTLNPTFTNVYANVFVPRCVSCHRPGAGGVNAGRLDLSTPAIAYAALVGVAGQGTGAGVSGVTCASLMPASIRVIAGDSANSLLFDKVNTKLLGVTPLCGSPMPLPASGAPLTQAQVDLIEQWIDAGALND